MNITMTAAERETLAAAQAQREAHLLDLGRRLVIGGEAPDPIKLTPPELARVHEHARRLTRLRDALLARRELPKLQEREQAARAEHEGRRQALLATIKAAEAELAMIGRPVHEASQAAEAARRHADEAKRLLAPAEAQMVAALEQRIAEARARAGRARKQAEDAPGALARAGERIAELTAALGRFIRGDGSGDGWKLGMEQRRREAEAEQARLAALSPRALLAEAQVLDDDAAQAERELAALWSKIEAGAGVAPAPSASARTKRAR